MARPSWLVIRVELLGGSGERIQPPPGRDFLASSDHSLLELGVAIDTAFARWDLGHLHLFRLPAGARYVMGGDEDGTPGTESVFVGGLGLSEGTEFEYVFDLGDEWLHRCEVRSVGVDPEELFGDVPLGPVPIFGWGSVPDQYGRTTPDG
jgi:hypothetical protein